jgi:mono/diheme cytochrome c family protein
MKRLYALLAALVAFAPTNASADDHDKAVYMANNCYLCHGTVGQGGAGPAIAPPHLMASYDAFAGWVRHTGTGQMPVYTAKALSDADLSSIYAYLKRLPPPSGIPAVLTHP